MSDRGIDSDFPVFGLMIEPLFHNLYKMCIRDRSNLGKTAMGGKLSDRPAGRTSLQEKLAAMKARVSWTPAGRDAADKTKKKEEIL